MMYAKVATGFQVRMLPGENAHDMFVQLAKKEEIKGAAITGLGAVKDIELGFLNLSEKKFNYSPHPEMNELTSMNGNITMVNGEPSVHIHANFSAEDHHVIGGHVGKMIVAVAIEAHVITHGVEIPKGMDEFSGLNMMQLPERL